MDIPAPEIPDTCRHYESGGISGYWIIAVAGLIVYLIGLYTRRHEVVCALAPQTKTPTPATGTEGKQESLPKRPPSRILAME